MPTSDAPIRIGRVALTVRDANHVADYYERVLGLSRLTSDGTQTVLGVGDHPILELRQDKAARTRPEEAGLFHTAFLLPDRAALGSWLRHVAATGTPIDGASDHLVSEAVYLRDPEGNGIEVYADRPRDLWRWENGEVRMDTRRMNVEAVMGAALADWSGAPAGTTIGHVHLQVGDIAQAEGFFADQLKMTRMAHRAGATFYASGGYHHHLAGNIWHSRGAGPRSPDTTGLAELVLDADPDTLAPGTLIDPWGTPVTIEARVSSSGS